jgi:glycosyltransferase involved in cell wall biosynthesis/GT2 family glycosyltransferase
MTTPVRSDTPGSDDAAAAGRPPVSVVVPFGGDRASAEAMFAALARLRLGPGDEVVVADNSPDLALSGLEPPERWRIVPATGEGSPSRARNAGALAARGEWLLFIDSDCEPDPGLIDAYFAEPIGERVGLVAGAIEPGAGEASLAAEFARTREVTTAHVGRDHRFMPFALTANLLVRRAAWEQVGGFLEGILSGQDVDLSWRIQRAGWTLEFRDAPRVVHHDRPDVRSLLRQTANRRASARWLHRRWPGSWLPPLHTGRTLARAAVAIPAFLLTGQLRRAALKALDAAVALAAVRGDLRANRAHPRPVPPATKRAIELWCDEFPVVSETFVVNEARALRALGHDVRVVATRRPDRPALGVEDVRARWLEDDSRLERLGALARVVARHPLRCARDLAGRLRWRREEQVLPLRMLAPRVLEAERRPGVVLHAHFAGVAALSAMRTARLAGRPWTLTAHAYDIYKLPRNLREKLTRAAFVTSGCDYTVRDLRRIAPGADVHRIVMGVDPERFRRERPYPGGRRVIAIGRLVEKKGFVHLVRAAADPALAGVAERIVIVGEGPLRDELAAEIERLGVGDVVELAGRRHPREIRDLLEAADVLAMPCVVAADGDRDSMPVVVKEALAMEVPVVVSDEVGLPELVRPEFGRIVPPGDPAALAAALAELLSLPPERRVEMGRAGRAFVAEHANVHAETARLSELFDRLPRARG